MKGKLVCHCRLRVHDEHSTKPNKNKFKKNTESVIRAHFFQHFSLLLDLILFKNIIFFFK